MILDTSALLAVLQDEPERERYVEAIETATSCAMSVVSQVEASILLLTRRGPDAVRAFDLFVARAAIELMPVDAEQALLARQAYRAFGKGRHAARLNFGDCFAYALSQATGEPLLYKGSDFGRTDVTPHAASG